MTILTLANLVKSKVYSDPFYSDADIKLWLSDGVRRFNDLVWHAAMKRANPDGTIDVAANASLKTIADQQEYDTKTTWNVADVHRILNIEVNSIKLIPRSYEEVRALQSETSGYPLSASSPNPITGPPFVYYTRGHRLVAADHGLIVGFYPIPEAVYNVDLTYEPMSATETYGDAVDLATLGVPLEFQRYVMNYALSNLLQDDRRYGDSNYHLSLWEKGVNEARISLDDQVPKYFNTSLGE